VHFHLTTYNYQGLCELIHRQTKGKDGVYFSYTNESPISFNPFYTDDYFFDVEKRESICTLLLTLWKSADEHNFVLFLSSFSIEKSTFAKTNTKLLWQQFLMQHLV